MVGVTRWLIARPDRPASFNKGCRTYANPMATLR
jgi:hypothetical protein